MAARRGTIRTELKVEGTESGQANFRKFKRTAESELSGVAKAFTGIQGSVRAFNQYKETFNAVSNAVRNFATRARELLSLNASTRAGFEQIDSTVTDLGRAFADAANDGGTLRNILNEVSGDLRGLRRDAENAGGALRTALNYWNETRAHDDTSRGGGGLLGGGLIAAAATAGYNELTRQQREREAAAENAAQAEHQRTLARLGGSGRGMLEPDPEAREETAAMLREIDEGFARAAEETDWANRALEGYRRNLRAAADEEAREREARASAGAGDAERIAEASALKLKADTLRIITEELQRQADIEERDQWRRNEAFAIEERANQRRIQDLQRVIEMNRQIAEEQRLGADKTKELLAQQMEVEQALIEYRKKQINEAQDKVEGYGDAILTVGGAVADVFGQLSSEQAEGSKAAERYKKIQGGILAGISFVRGAIELAAAISAGATYEWVSMAGHIASSVAYFAAGALALRNLGGSASRPTATTGFSASEKKTDAKQATGGGTTIITLGATDGRLARELQRSANSAARSGLDRSMGVGDYR